MTAMSHDLRAELDELIAQGGGRPVFHSLGQRQGAQDVAEIIGGQNRPEGTPVSVHLSDTPWSDREGYYKILNLIYESAQKVTKMAM